MVLFIDLFRIFGEQRFHSELYYAFVRVSKISFLPSSINMTMIETMNCSALQSSCKTHRNVSNPMSELITPYRKNKFRNFFLVV